MPETLKWLSAAIIGIPLFLLGVYAIFRVGSLGILASIKQFKKGKQ